jgi:hypothetical protein
MRPKTVLAPGFSLDAPAVIARDLDAVDMLVLDALGNRSGATPVNLRDFDGDASAVLFVSMTAVWAGRNPEQAEQALLGTIAPRLVTQLVEVCGDAWRAEAEAVVDLVLASRLEELPSLPVAIRGGIGVDPREVVDLLAPAVQHPQTVWLV